MVVEEMNILTTVFLRYDNTKVIIPNSVLATKAINNFYRSPDMGDGIDFSIHIATPTDKIATLRQRITKYVPQNNNTCFHIRNIFLSFHLMQLRGEQERALVPIADGHNEGSGWSDESENGDMAVPQNEPPRHGREVHEEIASDWRNGQDFQGAWHSIPFASARGQCPRNAHRDLFSAWLERRTV